MESVRDFKKIDKNDVFLAGGKGASLGEMTQVGIPVPPGFVILSTAFEKLLDEADLNVEIDSILDSVNYKKIYTVENASEKVKSLILQAEIPKDIDEEIQKYFKKLDSKYVAVRSSATAEDSTSAAWAGQLESYLNTTESNLLENVKKCWASLFTPRAIFYRFEKGPHKQKVSVAVVVQKMVESEKSGIAFSVHPVTQDRNQIIIEAGLGLGEAIVSGQITPDSYIVEKQPRRIVKKNVRTQSRGLYRAKNDDSEWRDIPKKQGEKQVLSDTEVLELTEIILRIENHYAFPVDIEWATENGKFYIVQSRPITTLEGRVNTEQEKERIIYGEDWIFLVGRPYTLFGASLYQSWFDPPQINKLLGVSIPDNLYVEEHPNVIRRYVVKEQLDTFTRTIKSIVINDRKKAKTILKKGLQLSEKAKKYIESSPFESLGGAVNFLVELALHATVFSYFSYPIAKEADDSELVKLAEKLRAVSYYPQVVAKVINPLAQRVVGEKYIFMTIEEILQKKSLEIKQREKMSKCGKRFIYAKVNEKEHIYYVDDVIRLIEKLEKVEIGETVRGQISYPGKVSGKVRLVLTNDINTPFDEGDILVAVTTNPTLMPLIIKSAAIVTDEGGITSHAAIMSRELKKPCVIGTKFATHTFKDGQDIEVDANTGVVSALE